MNRRKFLTRSTGVLGIIPLVSSFSVKEGNSVKEVSKLRLEKVKLAMLSMQRASWEHGVAMQAILELGEYELLYLMAQESVLRQLEDGRLSVVYTDNGITDPGASGEPVFAASNKFNDPNLKQASDSMLNYFLNKAPKSDIGIIYHTLNAPEFWIDSMYMLPPFLSVLGKHDEALKQISGLRNKLWNEEKKMFSHRWDNGKNEFINKNFWGVGNGWAAGGMARVIDSLPNSMIAAKKELIQCVQELLDSCLTYIRPDGLFHNNIDQNNTFIETNLSQMLAYTIYRGVKNQWLDKRYLEYANKMRNAAILKVDSFGFVQGVCGAPYFGSPGRAVEGQAFYILMETAYNKLYTL
jgi:unsaturated rhamnogalacturonyl hydrolase